jgi:hypothetical protein
VNHAQARQDAIEGFKRALNRPPSISEVLCLQAVGALETAYGRGWSTPESKGSFNMGAITAGGSWKGATFEHKDSMPQSDGTSTWYTTKFRKYPSAIDGWTDLARIMYVNRPAVLKAATAGDTFGVSAALYETKYFFGTGATIKTRIERHHTALLRWVIEQCQALGDPFPVGVELPRRTLRQGCEGPDVAELQRFLGAVADQLFGKETRRLVIAFQEAHGLEPDGVVGKNTFAVIDRVSDEKDAEVNETARKLAAEVRATKQSLAQGTA